MPFLIVDCNNFFVSCERVFDARLVGRPTVVLSNNDGCVISRSQEAKSIGVRMGEPAFLCAAKLHQHGVAVRSANFPLYGDMSHRVMETLAGFAEEMEIYSIDEAFLYLADRRRKQIAAVTAEMQARVQRWTGIPVSIGVAESKTLAKIANAIVKRRPDGDRALYFERAENIDGTLGELPVEYIWGIGRQSGAKLRSYGIRTALGLKDADAALVRKRLGVVGARTQTELQGTPCLKLDGGASRKMVLCSRSFGRLVWELGELRESIALYASRAAEKLRRQGSAARVVQVFVRTDKHRADQAQTSDAQSMTLPIASNYTPYLVAAAQSLLERIYRPGYGYMKAGVLLLDLCPQDAVQLNLFDTSVSDGERARQRQLMGTVDALNRRFGEGTVTLASAGIERPWYSRKEYASNRYTTRWEELLTVGEGNDSRNIGGGDEWRRKSRCAETTSLWGSCSKSQA